MIGRAKQSGFTLLELTLASMMIAILSLSMYASLRIAFNAKDSADAAVVPLRASHLAMELMRSDLESALNPNGVLAGPFQVNVIGDTGLAPGSVAFFTVGGYQDNTDPTRWGGIRQVEIGLAKLPDDPDHWTLVRRITSNLMAQVKPDPDQEVICRNVKTFEMQFFDGTTWQDYYDSTQVGDVLPVAIEVNLEVELPLRKGETQPGTYQITRVFNFPCHRDASTTSSGSGTGTGSGQ